MRKAVAASDLSPPWIAADVLDKMFSLNTNLFRSLFEN
jgi:hypothetical protein